ncbi:fumarate/nitrate reduction transcriptional regulator Fnr [Thiomicrorhabdus lithotrophica]|uniref:Fumarate/nitrate reduction transcriptional regulator Fnr n=1 Tax=Thiomicrorhabdus lithotrophica TaxID=2949997 RepID=A0ABY8CDM0_9GAMM|nr:fumarate/nitrate reduction transcriptional regulator Fnr [Thiomicrorhabdus lithotrophica]WEJ63332.1 fumarate/nitrate reduction transcriptional regulator Fnr [Thiomicrorhabdus lithotrophica]
MNEVKSAFNASCLNCGLQKICFPTGLLKADIDRLDDIVERKSPLKKNQHLYETGQKFNAIFAIRAGAVKLYSYSDSGEEIVHGFYLPGDVVGFDGLIENTYLYNAVALDSTSVCTLPYDQLSDLSLKIPNLNKQIMSVMSKKLQDGQLHSELLIKRNADQRVAQFIWNMAERYKNRGYAYDEFRLSILHRDVALYLGLTPETVSRILAKFNSDGIVSWKKKEVIIYSENKLKAVAGISNGEVCKEVG